MGILTEHLLDGFEDLYYGLQMKNSKYIGKEMILLTTTRADGSKHRCFYLYDTEAAHSEYKNGVKDPNVVRTREPYDGVSFLLTGNGD